MTVQCSVGGTTPLNMQTLFEGVSVKKVKLKVCLVTLHTMMTNQNFESVVVSIQNIKEPFLSPEKERCLKHLKYYEMKVIFAAHRAQELSFVNRLLFVLIQEVK